MRKHTALALARKEKEEIAPFECDSAWIGFGGTSFGPYAILRLPNEPVRGKTRPQGLSIAHRMAEYPYDSARVDARVENIAHSWWPAPVALDMYALDVDETRCGIVRAAFRDALETEYGACRYFAGHDTVAAVNDDDEIVGYAMVLFVARDAESEKIANAFPQYNGPAFGYRRRDFRLVQRVCHVAVGGAFRKTFGVSAESFRAWHGFDILQFEKWLQGKHSDHDPDESVHGLCTRHYGETGARLVEILCADKVALLSEDELRYARDHIGESIVRTVLLPEIAPVGLSLIERGFRLRAQW